METGIGDVGGSGNKQFNIPASNVDRVFHGYQYSHHNPYADMTGLGMGLDMLGDVNPMFVPNYNLYVYFIISLSLLLYFLLTLLHIHFTIPSIKIYYCITYIFPVNLIVQP